MAGNPNQKLKLLYLMEILSNKTDEDHTITMKDIIVELSKHNITSERKSIYKDMELLKQFGLDINLKNTKDYYIGQRKFQFSELKLLVDIVQSSKFITKKKSNELIKKLEGLTSNHLASQLQRQVFVIDRVKAMNEKIYYNIDTLHKAISSNKMVSFKYFEYTVSKKKQYKKNGQEYLVSPFSLSWANDRYYLISHYPEHGSGFTHFRVDRMADISLLENQRVDIKKISVHNEFNIAKYSKQIFSMFSGKSENLEILFHNSLIDTVIDRFGEDVPIIKADNEHFKAEVEVVISNAFFSWLFQFGDKSKVLSPKNAVEEMKALTEKVLNLY